MSTALKKLYQGQVPNTATTLYTVPALTEVVIQRQTAVNTSMSSADLTLWVDGTTDAHRIMGPSPIDANGGRGEDTEKLVLPAGSTLSGEASAASAITLTIYGTEHT